MARAAGSQQYFHTNHTNFLFLKGYFTRDVVSVITQEKFGVKKAEVETFLHQQVMEVVRQLYDGEDVYGDLSYSPGYSGDIFVYEFYEPTEHGDTCFLVGLHVNNNNCLFREFNNVKPRNILIESYKTVNRELFERHRHNLIFKNKDRYKWVYHTVLP